MNSIIEQLNQWGEILVPYALELVWQSSLLIFVLLALNLLLRKRVRAGVRYALWMLLLVKLVLPPSLALPTGAGYWVERRTVEKSGPSRERMAAPRTDFAIVETNPLLEDAGWNDMADFSFEEPVALELIPLPVVRPAIASRAWMLFTSICGSVFLFGWMLWRWAWVSRIVSESVPAAEGVQALARNSVDRRVASIRITERAISPALCGIFRPIILLPRKLIEKLSTDQLRTVVLHELIHLRRLDLWVNCAQTLLQIAFWWHPLLWIANAQIRRIREEAVDDAVVSDMKNNRDAYPQTLVEVAKLTFNRPWTALGLIGILESKSALKRRIRRLMDLPPLWSQPGSNGGTGWLFACSGLSLCQ